MLMPVIRGVIERRILVNYRLDAKVARWLAPAPFRPWLVNGYGMAGVCLIRLRNVRPRGLPACVGLSSENAAHRLAVEWEDQGKMRRGVYIWRRDTSSRINRLAGGTLFPGVHCSALFSAEDAGDRLSICMESLDGQASLALEARPAAALPTTSAFGRLETADAFFRAGAVGYSAARKWGELESMQLETFNWQMQPLAVDRVRSRFFDNLARRSPGAAEFDSAFLMRQIEHQWRAGENNICHRQGSQAAARDLADKLCDMRL